MMHRTLNIEPTLPHCNCDRCASASAGLPESLEMGGGCEGCGGRASVPPLCLSCMHHTFEKLIALVDRTINARSPWFGKDILQLLKQRKAQLPVGADRLGFWQSQGCRLRVL